MRPLNGDKRRRRLMTLPELGAIDGRSRPACLFREIAAAISSDLGGGEELTAAQKQLVRRAAGLGVLADQIETKLVQGEAVDAAEYSNIVGTQSRVLRTVGLARVPKEVPSLGQYLVQVQNGEGAF